METKSRYEALAGAAKSLSGWEIFPKWDVAEIADIRTFVEINHDVLVSAHNTLSLECSDTTEFDLSFLTKRLQDSDVFFDLCKAFNMEFRVAMVDDDQTGALRIGVDMLDLAVVVRQGGLVTDLLMSGGIAGAAVDSLRRIRSQFNEDQRIRLISELERIETKQDPLADIFERDRRWEIEVGSDESEDELFEFEYPPHDPAECGLSESEQMDLFKSADSLIQEYVDMPGEEQLAHNINLDKRSLALMRMLSVDLTLRSHLDLKSSYPNSLMLLCSDTKNGLPLDPFTDEPFIYRPLSTDSFELYSPGPGKIDHGGVFGSWINVRNGKADLCLDADDYDEDFGFHGTVPRGIVSRIGSVLRKAWTRWSS